MVDTAGFTSGWTSEPRFLTTESYDSRTNSIARRAYNPPAIVLHLLHFFRCGSCGRTGQPAPDEKEQIKALLARVQLVEKGVAELKVTMVASAAPAARDDVTVGRNNKLEMIRICLTVVCPRYSN